MVYIEQAICQSGLCTHLTSVTRTLWGFTEQRLLQVDTQKES